MENNDQDKRNSEDKRANNGGAREGAGRPSQAKVTATFTINKEVLDAARAKFPGKLSQKIEDFLRLLTSE